MPPRHSRWFNPGQQRKLPPRENLRGHLVQQQPRLRQPHLTLFVLPNLPPRHHSNPLQRRLPTYRRGNPHCRVASDRLEATLRHRMPRGTNLRSRLTLTSTEVVALMQGQGGNLKSFNPDSLRRDTGTRSSWIAVRAQLLTCQTPCGAWTESRNIGTRSRRNINTTSGWDLLITMS